MKSGKPQTLKEALRRPKNVNVIQRRDPNGHRYESFMNPINLQEERYAR